MDELSYSDLQHAPTIGPHWNLKDIFGRWRIFRYGGKLPKK